MNRVGPVAIVWVTVLSAVIAQSRVERPRARGRSLRDLVLQSRLFKDRCSCMIYSPAFDALPAGAHSALLTRLTDRDTIAILDEMKAEWD